MKNKQPWFKAKMYGWGWYPSSWQGWVIILLYLGGLLQFAAITNKNSETPELGTFMLFFIMNTVFLLIICYAKGERPRFRWRR